MFLKICKNCGTPNNDTADMCLACGETFTSEINAYTDSVDNYTNNSQDDVSGSLSERKGLCCYNCGFINEMDARNCLACGVEFLYGGKENDANFSSPENHEFADSASEHENSTISHDSNYKMCTFCGMNNTADVNNCVACGMPFAKNSSEEPGKSQKKKKEKKQSPKKDDIQEPKKAKSKKGIIIAAVMTSILAVAVVITIVVLTKSNKAPDSSYLRTVEVGEIIELGTYQQDLNEMNGKETIEWRVLDRVGNKILLLSENVLDCRMYVDDPVYDDYTWENSGLRKWLNNEFIEENFTAEEKARMISTVVYYEDYDSVGSNVVDKMFLLSVDEANEYLPQSSEKICYPTKYADFRGAQILELKNDNEACCWLLRTCGDSDDIMACIDEFGETNYSGVLVVMNPCNLRPAFWFDISDDLSEARKPLESEAEDYEYEDDITESDDRIIKKSALADAVVGDFITFGSYEQDDNLANGTEPIEWRVLEKIGDDLLVVSRYVLDTVRYSTYASNVTWEKCNARKWLNDEFFNEAFTAEDKARIQKTYVDTDDKMTGDYVFLLDAEDADRFFASDNERRCAPTKFASAKGVYEDFGYGVNGSGSSWWWLRFTAIQSSETPHIGNDGAIYHNGLDVKQEFGGIRPAMLITVSDDIQTTWVEPSAVTTDYIFEDIPLELEAYADLLRPENKEYVVDLEYDDWYVNLRNTPEYLVSETEGADNVVGKLKCGTTVCVEYIYNDIWAVFEWEGQYVFASLYDSNNPNAEMLFSVLYD